MKVSNSCGMFIMKVSNNIKCSNFIKLKLALKLLGI